MKVAVVQYDNRTDQQLGHFLALVELNSQYTARHGYDHLFIRKLKNVSAPPYWRKVFLLRQLLADGYDFLLWLDTDAVVCDIDIKIESILSGDEVFAYSRDVPAFQHIQRRAEFNAGAFICSSGAIELFDYWISLYNPEYWICDASKGDHWTCTHGDWAGVAFEQEQFCRNVIPRYEGTGLLKPMHWRFFQSPWPTEGGFVLHFPTVFKAAALQYLLRDEE